MAGGQFNKNISKVRPGTYINFESGRQKGAISDGTRGTVLVPLFKTTYGPAKQFIKITSDNPDGASTMLGYSIFDNDENRQMLLIKEALRRSSTVLAYILSEGAKASATISMTTGDDSDESETSTTTMTAKAKYGGTRGNALTVTVSENPLKGCDVTVHLAGNKVALYEGLSTIEELKEVGDAYIDFTGSGALGEAAGVTLTGGTDKEITNADITEFIDAWERIKFNTVCFPFDGDSMDDVKQAASAKVKFMRDSMGRGIQVVMPNSPNMNYEGIINVTNSVSLNGDALTTAEACAWVAGATAGASNTESLTYLPYTGATEVVNPKSSEAAVDAIKAGEFFFSLNDNFEVVAEYDINSLITYGEKKDQSYRKNRIIRVFDTFQEAIQLNLPPNKFSNNAQGWEIMEGIGKAVLRQFEDAGAIMNVSYDDDFKVDREISADDETYFNVSLQPVDSAEKLYFTIITR